MENTYRYNVCQTIRGRQYAMAWVEYITCVIAQVVRLKTEGGSKRTVSQGSKRHVRPSWFGLPCVMEYGCLLPSAVGLSA